MRDNGGIQINTINWDTIKNKGIQWTFDKYSNSIQNPSEDDLFTTYKVDDELYIDINTLLTDQPDILDTIVYAFDVYKINKLKTHGSIANRTVYTSVNDCLDAALLWISENEELIETYFNLDEIDLLHEDIKLESEIKIGTYYYTPDTTDTLDPTEYFIKHKH
jgi:hypothetical protein